MSDPLKPCPFCGNDDGDRLVELWEPFDDGHVAHVHCEKCGAGGPSEYSALAVAALTLARAKWNARAR